MKDDADKLLESAVSDLWGATVEGVNKVGKGYLVVGMKLADALKALGLKPHFWDNGASVLWSERTIDGAHWYYLAAPVGGGFHGPVRLEGKGRAEWWNPVDGTIKSLRTKGWGRMKTITLDLERAESGFVVFRGRSSRPVASRTRAFEEKRRLTSIKLEDWRVSFPEGWGIIGGPITLDDLRPWKDLDLGDEGKAFSGTATYETRFEVNKDLIGKEMVLNLGNVEMIADSKREECRRPLDTPLPDGYQPFDYRRKEYPDCLCDKHLVQPSGLRCVPTGTTQEDLDNRRT